MTEYWQILCPSGDCSRSQPFQSGQSHSCHLLSPKHDSRLRYFQRDHFFELLYTDQGIKCSKHCVWLARSDLREGAENLLMPKKLHNTVNTFASIFDVYEMCQGSCNCI